MRSHRIRVVQYRQSLLVRQMISRRIRWRVLG